MWERERRKKIKTDTEKKPSEKKGEDFGSSSVKPIIS